MIIMLRILLLVFLSLADNLVYYKFGSNFGQIFYDYSGKGNHGQNGISTSSTTADTTPTDRGAYFIGTSYIMLPPNNVLSTAVSIGSTFSIIIWIKPLDNTDYYLTYRIYDASNFFYAFRLDVGNYIRSQIKRPSYDSGTRTATTGNIAEGNF